MATTPGVTGADDLPKINVPDPTDTTNTTDADLGVARALVEFGVPVFAAPPNPQYGKVDGDGHRDERMFLEPTGWQTIEPDLAQIDRWQSGWMLAAVTGRAADVIDTDPRNGGEDSRQAVDLLMPEVFGRARSQQNGTHEWIPRLHRRKRSGSGALLPGLDILAGDDDGRGRAYVRIPPTVTPLGAYRWEVPPDLQALSLFDPEGVRRFVEEFYDPGIEEGTCGPPAPAYDGHPLSDRERAYLDAALHGEAREVAAALNGTRNERLFKAARRMGNLVAGAGLDSGEVIQALSKAASETGLMVGAIQKTISSGMTIGRAYPRSVPSGEGAEPDDRAAPGDADLVDLLGVLDGGQEGPCPTVLRVEGGEALFYPGSLNGLMGEPESGKSWLALAAVAEVAHADEVLYVDLEDSPATAVERLTLLGLDRDGLGRVQYSQPQDAAQLRRRLERAAVNPPALVVIDSIGEFLAFLGLNPSDNGDVASAFQEMLRPLARAGSCVVTLDHVVKSRDSRSRYPIGAQAKLAAISGAMYTVEALQPLGRGRTGQLKITVSKDRPGRVRGWAAGGKVVGVAEVTSDVDRVNLLIRPEVIAGSGWSPTKLMQRVSEFLEGRDEPVSRNEIEEAVTGKSSYVRQAINCLLEQGFAETVKSGRHPKVRSVKPFRESA